MQFAQLFCAGLAVASLSPVLAAATPAGENQAPVCVIAGGDITVTANGPLVVIPLDGCDSFDPDVGQTISFAWFACPGTGLSTPNECTTDLVIDTTQVTLPFQCGVRLEVQDGQGPDSYNVCRIEVTILPPEPCEPDLDILPGGCPNDVKVWSCDSIPVALVGTECFDVCEVDTKSLRLERVDGVGGDVKPWKVSVKDIATPFENDACECHKKTKDGLPDLYLKFWSPALVYDLKLHKEKNKTYVPLVLRGKLESGEKFEVFDCVRVIGCK